jgi:ankyrin repeat protein
MKHILTTIAAVVLIGCGVKTPDISLEEAVEQGNVEAIKQHLASGTDVNGSENSPPLFYAQTKEVLELLVANGADVNAPRYRDFKENGTKILHDWALMPYGKIELIESLIENGADVNAKDQWGNTPLDKAIEGSNGWHGETRNQKKRIVELLRKLGGKSGAKDSIVAAVNTGNFEAAKALISNAPEEKEKINKELLFSAIRKNHAEIVGLLLTSDVDWGTALHDSLHLANSSKVAELLIANGASLKEQSDYSELGYSPLHSVISNQTNNPNSEYNQSGSIRIIELFIENGANVNALDSKGNTPLDLVGRFTTGFEPGNPNSGADPSSAQNEKSPLIDLLRKHGAKTSDELTTEEK